MYKKNYAIVLKDARGNITSMPLNIYNKKSTRIKNTPMSNGKTHRGFTYSLTRLYTGSLQVI